MTSVLSHSTPRSHNASEVLQGCCGLRTDGRGQNSHNEATVKKRGPQGGWRMEVGREREPGQTHTGPVRASARPALVRSVLGLNGLWCFLSELLGHCRPQFLSGPESISRVGGSKNTTWKAKLPFPWRDTGSGARQEWMVFGFCFFFFLGLLQAGVLGTADKGGGSR